MGTVVSAKLGEYVCYVADPTPAPLGDVSIGAAIEAFTGAKFGSSGTLTAARIITAAVKAVPETQIGYSGLMVSVRATHLFEDSTSDFKRALVFRLGRYENPASVGYKCNAY
jgi:uncharacterized protein (UPF0210 family)